MLDGATLVIRPASTVDQHLVPSGHPWFLINNTKSNRIKKIRYTTSSKKIVVL